MKNIVTCFTKEEKEQIKELCDFTPTEETLFDLRKKEKSLEECAEIMHVSTQTAGRIMGFYWGGSIVLLIIK